MQVLVQPSPSATPIPGVSHSTWAGRAQGLDDLSIWRQSIAAGGATPPHAHACDEVVLCLAGQGEVQSEGRTLRFGPNSTIVLPKNQLHQLWNVGTEALELVGIFAATPVGTFLPDGSTLALPWES